MIVINERQRPSAALAQNTHREIIVIIIIIVVITGLLRSWQNATHYRGRKMEYIRVITCL